jgi:hypothetical protein
VGESGKDRKCAEGSGTGRTATSSSVVRGPATRSRNFAMTRARPDLRLLRHVSSNCSEVKSSASVFLSVAGIAGKTVSLELGHERNNKKPEFNTDTFNIIASAVRQHSGTFMSPPR